jgi:tetratricopeptide (TPR) repeat protein
VLYADRALAMAKAIGYPQGIAEAYRIRGVGEYYLNRPDSAITDYFEALKEYETIHDQPGQAKVYNNIGNLYQEADYKKALEYFYKAQVIANATHNEQLIASLNLNIGTIYYHQNLLNQALKSYKLSFEQFTKLNNKTYLVQCMQDLGIIYKKLDQIDQSEKILLQANHDAKAQDMNSSIASINFTLVDIYISQNRFAEAEQYLKEGQTCAQLINNDRDLNDYDMSWYQLEFKRKNYQGALLYLTKIFKKDSVTYNANLSTNFNLASKEKAHENDVEMAAIKTAQTTQRFWLLAAVAGLLVIVIGLLLSNVKRKALTNNKLTELNNEVSRQKENLDRINHHLEEIIDERTKDLQVKNKKLSEYSSYLSHQIRGPIATLKGLMNLEREGLVDQAECINMMDKCVSEIDEKIIEMSDMLHDPGKTLPLANDY